VTNSWLHCDVLSDAERLQVLDLINRTEQAIGREALDETRRRGVVHGWRAQHWLRYDGDTLVQYAVLTEGEPPSLEVCGGGFDPSLRDAVLAIHPTVDWWIRHHPVTEGEIVRRLQVHSIDLTPTAVSLPEGSLVRTFESGADEEAWLTQNNAAFTDHPEQGAWRMADLHSRIAEPWFDPSGFLLLEFDGKLAAACWTKVHELYRERLGEIYVLSVAPDFQGRGLGKTMLLLGLTTLRNKGVKRAILFVDAANHPAIALYESVGFRMEREDYLVRFTNR
jgi:mycothiol synthase